MVFNLKMLFLYQDHDSRAEYHLILVGTICQPLSANSKSQKLTTSSFYTMVKSDNWYPTLVLYHGYNRVEKPHI